MNSLKMSISLVPKSPQVEIGSNRGRIKLSPDSSQMRDIYDAVRNKAQHLHIDPNKATLFDRNSQKLCDVASLETVRVCLSTKYSTTFFSSTSS